MTDQNTPAPADLVEVMAKALAKADGLNWDEVCALEAGADDCDSGTCVAAHDEDHDPIPARAYYRKRAQASIAAYQAHMASDGVVQADREAAAELYHNMMDGSRASAVGIARTQIQIKGGHGDGSHIVQSFAAHRRAAAVVDRQITSKPVVAHGSAETIINAAAGKGYGWRSMDSAPKDGTAIMLWAPVGEFQGKPTDERVTIGHWTTEEECREQIGDCGGECRCPEYKFHDPYWLSWDGGFTEENPPFGWMPLPAAPGTIPHPDHRDAVEPTVKENLTVEMREYAGNVNDRVMIWVNGRDLSKGGYCIEGVPRHVAPIIATALANSEVR